MKTLKWSIDSQLQEEAESNYRTKYALSLADKNYLDIVRDLTFDQAAPLISIGDIERLFSYLERFFLEKKISGIGLEIGAGPAVFGAVLAKRPAVEKIYAVEICHKIVEVLMPKVVREIAGDDNAQKIIGCVGDFNNLEIEKNSVDFVVDFFSLHHSFNLKQTLGECFRVLKPGGFVIALDKARPDELKDGEMQLMLDYEYDGDYKSKFGIALSKKLTRRENGEREYRLSEWQAAFLESGFKSFSHHRLDQISGSFWPLRLIKKAISIFSPDWQVSITKYLPRQRDLFALSFDNRVFTPVIENYRKEMSLMVAIK